MYWLSLAGEHPFCFLIKNLDLSVSCYVRYYERTSKPASVLVVASKELVVWSWIGKHSKCMNSTHVQALEQWSQRLDFRVRSGFLSTEKKIGIVRSLAEDDTRTEISMEIHDGWVPVRTTKPRPGEKKDALADGEMRGNPLFSVGWASLSSLSYVFVSL